MKKKEYIQPELLSVLLPFVPLMAGSENRISSEEAGEGSGNTGDTTPGSGGDSGTGEGVGGGSLFPTIP